MTSNENVKYFIEKWNDLDIIISSMDIKGYNVTVLDREIISEDNLEEVVCSADEGGVALNLTAKQLISCYLNEELKVFK